MGKAELLNKVFSQNFTVDNGIKPPLQLKTENTLCTINFSAQTVTDVLRSFKNSHAVGPDNFSAAFYKKYAYELSFPLFRVLDSSFKLGKLPSCWKTACVIPVYKKGNAANPENYRPISLTCVPCKILERIIRDKLVTYLSASNLVDPNQFGFLRGRSSTLHLLRCLDDWTLSLDVGVPTDVIMIDYAKAFDSVSHDKLCYKLSRFGLGGNVLLWITDFLSNRLQCVRINCKNSEMRPVTSGVPQGSILGPVLFTIFISDLQVDENLATMPKFADDVDLYRGICNADDQNKLVSALQGLENWSNDWQLPISTQKCSVFQIGTNDLSLDYSLSGNLLNTVSLTKNLGV